MPISRYRCKKCGKEFQVFQKITDSPLKNCSFCNGKVDLIPVPLFYNTPSFSLAFANKEEEKKDININKIAHKSKGLKSKAKPPTKKPPASKAKKPASKKAATSGKKNNKAKKMKK